MTKAEIKKELKVIQNRIDELIEELAAQGATREDVEELIEALTKIRHARVKIDD